MVKPTKHRDKILEALRKWFRIHKQSPSLEELCRELGMEPKLLPRKSIRKRISSFSQANYY
ncbi:MAG: hypothetical protein AAFW70_13170 [Cyanobacteria bacterium J06635_10]